MSNRSIKNLIVFLLGLCVMACNKQGEAVVRPKYGNAIVTAFTVDSLVFAVYLNNAPLVDTLASPVASVLKQFSFYDPVAHLQVYDKTASNRMIIDTNIRVQIGFNNINIVQFSSEEKPFLPSPPAEPLPDAGYCKVKLVYTAPPGAPYLDSVKCVVRIDTSASGNGSAPYSADTITLSRYAFSDRYYVVKKSVAGFRVRVYHPVTNTLIQETSYESTDRYLDFNSVGLMAYTISGATTANYRLTRVF